MSSNEPIPIDGKCHATAKSKKPCGAPAVRGTQYCSLHFAPNRAAELGRRGGQKNRIQLFEPPSEFVAVPQNPTEVTQMLGRAIKMVYEGDMTPKTGTALSYMAMAFVKAYEVSVLHAEVAALEELNSELSKLRVTPPPTAYVTVPSEEEFDKAVEEEITRPYTGTA